MNLYELPHSGTELTLNKPKLTTKNFQIKNSYYVATDGHSYHYYGVKLLPDEGGPLLRFEKLPPIRIGGYVVVEGRIYSVSAADLSRLIVRKSKEIKLGELNGTNPTDTTTSSVAANSNGNTIIQHPIESGIIDPSEVEVGALADAAWEGEIKALLNTIAQKEGESDEYEIEWETSNNT